MKGIIKQATDGQYLDLWYRQKLSSELELKQQHISKVNQVDYLLYSTGIAIC